MEQPASRGAHDRHESKEKECRNKGVTTHHMESSVPPRALVIDVGTRCHHLRQLIRFAIPCTFDSLGTCGGWGHRQLALPPCLNSGLNSAPSLGGSIYCPHNHCFRVTLHCLLIAWLHNPRYGHEIRVSGHAQCTCTCRPLSLGGDRQILYKQLSYPNIVKALRVDKIQG